MPVRCTPIYSRCQAAATTAPAPRRTLRRRRASSRRRGGMRRHATPLRRRGMWNGPTPERRADATPSVRGGATFTRSSGRAAAAMQPPLGAQPATPPPSPRRRSARRRELETVRQSLERARADADELVRTEASCRRPRCRGTTLAVAPWCGCVSLAPASNDHRSPFVNE